MATHSPRVERSVFNLWTFTPRLVSIGNERTRSVHHIHVEADAVPEHQAVRYVYCSRDMVNL